MTNRLLTAAGRAARANAPGCPFRARTVDLHVHSTCSDGTDAPSVLIEKIKDIAKILFWQGYDRIYGTDQTSKVLNDINFSVGKGEIFALVGPSGGGKTTICHLIPHFYDISAGRIGSRCGGHPKILKYPCGQAGCLDGFLSVDNADNSSFVILFK